MYACSPVKLETARIDLTMPPPDAAALVAAFLRSNRRHVARWDPPRPEGFFRSAYWSKQLERNRQEYAEGRSMRLWLVAKRERMVVGSANFTNVSRGPLQACTLGYAIDRRCEGQGLMYEALREAIRHVFEGLRLHRIEANYMPVNERSGRLLRRLGFAVEGYARDYLFIDGAWRDHVRTALANPEPSLVEVSTAGVDDFRREAR